MLLVMTLVVRDEEDIIETTLDYHLQQGVDLVLVTDHNSRDGTRAILERYARAGTVRVFHEGGEAHDQRARVNRMIGVATSEYQADWLIHCDADEFWWPAVGNLRDVFARVPERFDYVEVRRHNFIPVTDCGTKPHLEAAVFREARSLNSRGVTIGPKVAHRGRAGVQVSHGNHRVDGEGLLRAPDIGALEIFHFPARSYPQFERKVVNTGTGYEHLAGRDPDIGFDQLELLDRYRAGTLPQYFRELALSPAERRAAVRENQLIEDRRLSTFLAANGGPAGASEAQRNAALGFLADAWRLRADLAVSEEAASQVTGLESELRFARERLLAAESQLQAQDAALRRTQAELEQARNSRLLRLSAPARRVYHRLRPRSQ